MAAKHVDRFAHIDYLTLLVALAFLAHDPMHLFLVPALPVPISLDNDVPNLRQFEAFCQGMEI